MILHEPFQISARLLPALKIGGGWISLEYTGENTNYDKPIYRWYIDIPAGEFSEADLASRGNFQDVFTDLLGFMTDTPYNFPDPVAVWIRQHNDELESLHCEIEETPNLIKE